MSAATVQLAGSVALVTGGGRGVGRVLARALAAVGAAVGLIARSRGQLTESVRLIEAAGGVATVASANLSDPESATTAMDKLRHELGPVDLAREQRRSQWTGRLGLGRPGRGLVAHRRDRPPHDDLDALVSRTEDVLRDDLHVLRLRDLPT